MSPGCSFVHVLTTECINLAMPDLQQNRLHQSEQDTHGLLLCYGTEGLSSNPVKLLNEKCY